MDQDSALCDAIIRNVQFTQALVKAGKGPQLIGTVCGTKSGQAFWQHLLQDTKQSFGAEIALSLQEDLPVGQAFGLLYLWHQLKPHTNRDMNPLIAFVFGSGTRSTPFTEHDCGQKPAIASFVMDSSPGMKPRFLSMVELAMEYFIGVQHHLHQSGFRGLIVKWGDEVQVPITDLAQQNPLFQNADIVRFVSLQTMTEDTASNKDWVGV
ncbi:MAG: hypothetical protein KDD62_07265, partial [Bdellovibrionales bacterium]|nr:hypothetical protein [Bdellovibrionales bacterium]